VQCVEEAVPEVLDLKLKVFREIEGLCSEEVMLATNTSGLSVTSIGSSCQYPERVVGFHWVNPPELVPLVEVIRGKHTNIETAQLASDLAQKLGKVPIIIRKEVPGFAMNRLQFAVLREALYLVEEGVLSPEDVDKAMSYGLGFRYPWLGPMKTADLGGLDVFHSIASYLFRDLSSMKEPPESFRRLIDEGKLGIKTGRGFYDYENESTEEILRKRDLYFVRQWKLIREVQGT
jgi:3-hydroxybutyryl-CoA dehydrogenase